MSWVELVDVSAVPVVVCPSTAVPPQAASLPAVAAAAAEPGAPVAEAAAAQSPSKPVAAVPCAATRPRLLLTAVGAQLFVFNTNPLGGLQVPHPMSPSSQVHRQSVSSSTQPTHPLQLIASVLLPARIAWASIAALTPEPRDAQAPTVPPPPAVVVILLTTGLCLTLSLWDLSAIGPSIPLPAGVDLARVTVGYDGTLFLPHGMDSAYESDEPHSLRPQQGGLLVARTSIFAAALSNHTLSVLAPAFTSQGTIDVAEEVRRRTTAREAKVAEVKARSKSVFNSLFGGEGPNELEQIVKVLGVPMSADNHPGRVWSSPHLHPDTEARLEAAKFHAAQVAYAQRGDQAPSEVDVTLAKARLKSQELREQRMQRAALGLDRERAAEATEANGSSKRSAHGAVAAAGRVMGDNVQQMRQNVNLVSELADRSALMAGEAKSFAKAARQLKEQMKSQPGSGSWFGF